MPTVFCHPTKDGRGTLAKRKINSSLGDRLRRAIRDSGLSLYELGRRSGVNQAMLSRFMRNERTLTLPAASKICDALGLGLLPMPEGEKKPRKKGE